MLEGRDGGARDVADLLRARMDAADPWLAAFLADEPAWEARLARWIDEVTQIEER